MVHLQTNSDGTPSKNLDDNYLKFKNNQIYRYSDNILAMLLVSGSSSVNSLMPKFKEAGIEVFTIISPEVCEEAIIGFNEEQIHKVHKIVKIMTMGSNQQLKDQKAKIKADKLKQKLKESKINKIT